MELMEKIIGLGVFLLECLFKTQGKNLTSSDIDFLKIALSFLEKILEVFLAVNPKKSFGSSHHEIMPPPSGGGPI